MRRNTGAGPSVLALVLSMGVVAGGAVPALAAGPSTAVADTSAELTDLERAPEASSAGAPAPVLQGGDAVVKELDVTGGVVGVSFEQAPAADSVQIRVQTEGAWSPWQALEVEGSATEPLWIGDSADSVTVQVALGAQDAQVAALSAVSSEVTAADRAVTRSAGAQPTILTRAQWGADERVRTCTPKTAPLKAATVHHAASANGYSSSEVPSIIRGFYTYHVKTQGWCDLGYNFLVDRFGRTWEGRYGSLAGNVVGAHASGYNTGTVGVSMIGNYDKVDAPSAMVESVANVIAWKLGTNGISPKGSVKLGSKTLPTIFAHRDVGSTACPGRYAYAKMGTIRDRANSLVGSYKPVTTPTPRPTPTPTPKPTPKPVPVSPITAKWNSVGGANGFLGKPTSDERTLAAGGQFRHYVGGSIFDGPSTNAQFVRGDVLKRWVAMNWEKSYLKFPTTDELPTADKVGRYNHFQGGSIYWHPKTGAHDLGGAVRTKWAALGWERSALGYPTTNQAQSADKKHTFNHFQNGSIYAGPKGTFVVEGPVDAKYKALGREKSKLGHPTSNVVVTSSTRVGKFEGGTITVVRKTGVITVRYGR